MLKDIENTTKPVFDHPMYRVYPKTKQELLEEGVEYPDDTELELIQNPEQLHYVGNKWGGKYLRAPEIYFKILEKGKDKLVRLGDIAEVMSGIITGNNQMYYNKRIENFDISKYSLVFKSPRDVDSIIISSNDAKWIIKKEKKFLNKKTTFLTGDTKNDKFIFHYNKDNIIFEHKFIGINFLKNIESDSENIIQKILISLNSTLTVLFLELYGKSNLGQGALYLVPADLKKIYILKPAAITSYFSGLEIFQRPIKSIFTELGFDKTRPIREQEPNPLPDRKELDDIVFDALGLTEEERKEVYWAVAELVKARLDKAKSV